MSREQIVEKKNWYYTIDGSFRQKVEQDHPEAVRRDWKSADGKTSGTKYERIISALFGKIEKVEFVAGDYGLNINITLDKNDDGINPNISLLAASREGEDFLKKLPNIDLSKEVRLMPFNFDDDNDREVRGLSITQQDNEGNFKVKIMSFFFDPEKKENINGYPVVADRDAMDKEDWKVFFIQARKFLVKYAEENIIPKLAERTIGVSPIPKSYEEEHAKDPLENEFDPSKIPF